MCVFLALRGFSLFLCGFSRGLRSFQGLFFDLFLFVHIFPRVFCFCKSAPGPDSADLTCFCFDLTLQLIGRPLQRPLATGKKNSSGIFGISLGRVFKESSTHWTIIVKACREGVESLTEEMKVDIFQQGICSEIGGDSVPVLSTSCPWYRGSGAVFDPRLMHFASLVKISVATCLRKQRLTSGTVCKDG